VGGPGSIPGRDMSVLGSLEEDRDDPGQVLYNTLLPERWRIKVEAQPLGILSLSSQRDRCRTLRLHDYRVQEYRLAPHPSIKCKVIRESLSKGKSNYSLSNTKEKEVVGNLCISLVAPQQKWFHKKGRTTAIFLLRYFFYVGLDQAM
jgi:hypothetical protein